VPDDEEKRRHGPAVGDTEHGHADGGERVIGRTARGEKPQEENHYADDQTEGPPVTQALGHGGDGQGGVGQWGNAGRRDQSGAAQSTDPFLGRQVVQFSGAQQTGNRSQDSEGNATEVDDPQGDGDGDRGEADPPNHVGIHQRVTRPKRRSRPW